MKTLTKTLQQISNGLFLIQKIVLSLAIVVIVAINFVNVFTRYLLHYSLPFCEMLSIVLFMFMVMIGGNIAVKSDSEIKIEIFKFKTRKSSAGFHFFGDVVSIVAVVLVLIGSVAMIKNTHALPEQVIPLPMFTYHEYIIMAAGLVLILLDHIIQLCKRILCLAGKTEALAEIEATAGNETPAGEEEAP